jgi:hypothetical protein
MCLAVDAPGEPAHHDETSRRELAAEQPGHARSVRRAGTGADDRDRRTREQLRVGAAAQEEAGRRIVDRAQELREGPIRAGEEAKAATLQPPPVLALIERGREAGESAATRPSDHVRVGLGGERGQRELRHDPISRGVR